MENSAIQDWLAVHRELITREAAFTDLAIQAARGELPMEELDRRRAELVELRNRCAAVYDRAFPRPKELSGN